MGNSFEGIQTGGMPAAETVKERKPDERLEDNCCKTFGQSGSYQDDDGDSGNGIYPDDGCREGACSKSDSPDGSSLEGSQPIDSASNGSVQDDSRHNKDLGERGERAARQYLERRGLEIVDMNWRCPFGEADIIAIEDGVLAFIEVKTRADEEMGFPEEAVTKEKRARYEKIAAAYLANHDHGDMPIRFDVISITMIASDRAFLRHHRNAFGLGD